MPARKAPKRISLRLSPKLMARLQVLADLGIHGSNPTEVAENLVREQIVRIVETEFVTRAQWGSAGGGNARVKRSRS